jgi:hypothetical protein
MSDERTKPRDAAGPADDGERGGSGTSGPPDELERQAGAYARDAEQADQDTAERTDADPRAS